MAARGVWQWLGIAQALREALARRQFTVGMERVLLALVASRAIAPSSKLAAAEWASQDVVIPGLDRMGKGLYATKHGERLHSLAVR